MAELAAPPSGPRRQPQPWTWRLQALLSAYLPLLLMAGLAAFTWWLVKHAPQAEGEAKARALRHVPDYEMSGFELQHFGTDGVQKVRIAGDQLRHYPDTDTVEIDGVQVRIGGQDGSLTLATARRAISNGDGSELQLQGEVRVQRFDVRTDGGMAERPRLEVQGEFLQVFPRIERMRSHLPVTVLSIGGELQAQSFDYDNLSGQLSFKGRSSARFDPPGRRQP